MSTLPPSKLLPTGVSRELPMSTLPSKLLPMPPPPLPPLPFFPPPAAFPCRCFSLIVPPAAAAPPPPPPPPVLASPLLRATRPRPTVATFSASSTLPNRSDPSPPPSPPSPSRDPPSFSRSARRHVARRRITAPPPPPPRRSRRTAAASPRVVAVQVVCEKEQRLATRYSLRKLWVDWIQQLVQPHRVAASTDRKLCEPPPASPPPGERRT
jgi:hypothetical protein